MCLLKLCDYELSAIDFWNVVTFDRMTINSSNSDSFTNHFHCKTIRFWWSISTGIFEKKIIWKNSFFHGGVLSVLMDEHLVVQRLHGSQSTQPSSMK